MDVSTTQALRHPSSGPQRRQWHPTLVLLPGKSHGQRSLVGCSPWGHEESTRPSDFTFTFHFPALEKEMETHSSVLAWRIPGTVKPGGLPSVGLHRVGHDWRDLAAAVAAEAFKSFIRKTSYSKVCTLTFPPFNTREYSFWNFGSRGEKKETERTSQNREGPQKEWTNWLRKPLKRVFAFLDPLSSHHRPFTASSFVAKLSYFFNESFLSGHFWYFIFIT